MLTGNIGSEVCKQQIGIVVQQVVGQPAEQLAVAVRKKAVTNEVDNVFQLRVCFIVVIGIITFGLELVDLVGCETKEKEILFADFFTYLNIGTIQCPYR